MLDVHHLASGPWKTTIVQAVAAPASPPSSLRQEAALW